MGEMVALGVLVRILEKGGRSTGGVPAGEGGGVRGGPRPPPRPPSGLTSPRHDWRTAHRTTVYPRPTLPPVGRHVSRYIGLLID